MTLKAHIAAVIAIIGCMGLEAPAWGYYFPAPIDYTQQMTVIVTEDQLQGWPSGNEQTKRDIAYVGTSADGTRVAFQVFMDYLSHLYVVEADGSELQDLTGFFSETFRYWPIQLNDDGSRLFCGQGDDISICDLNPTPACQQSVVSGIWNYDRRKPYTINADGTVIYFKHDAGWDPDAERFNRGLYYATVPGTPTKIMDIDQLPCDSECGNMNMMDFLGAATDGSAQLFAFNRDYWHPPAESMWTVVGGGNPRQAPIEEHDYVWDVQSINNRIIDAYGTRAVYHFIDDWIHEVHVVDLASGVKRRVAEGKPDHWISISPDGDHVRLTTTHHNATMVRLEVDPMPKRDTGSYYIEPFACGYHFSDLTADNRRYFMSGSCPNQASRLYRVDMNPTAVGRAPTIRDIRFSAAALMHADGGTITVTARVEDPDVLAGQETLVWVKLCSLVEGREHPDWPMARPPLAFPAGDAGATELYDDGAAGGHGDLVAGDGIYTFDSIATRKGNYDTDNTWYSHFTLPHPVGIRIIAQDSSGNYGMADTQLMIADAIVCEGDLDFDHDVDGKDLAALASVPAPVNAAGVASQFGRTDCF